MVLIFVASQRKNVPFHRIFFLFAAFILACGFSHLVDAVTFYVPVYRLLGLIKGLTAVISLVTVAALVPALPRALAWIEEIKGRPEHIVLPPRRVALEGNARIRQYIIAILAAVLALLIRGALSPLLHGDHVFVLSLLAVIASGWLGGFGPALVTLTMTLIGTVYFFVEPRWSLLIALTSDQLAVGLFFFCGLVAALLGEAQRAARRQAEATLGDIVRKQADLEAEVARRCEIETALRLSASPICCDSTGS